MIAHAEPRTLKSGKVRWYAVYVAPSGKRTTEGGFTTKREAERVAVERAREVETGGYLDPKRSRMSFRAYVETFYWPTTAHLEPTTRAAYRSNLDRHFLPAFGSMAMRQILPSVVQAWVNSAAAGDAGARSLSSRSVVKYHTLLHSIFAQAVVDQAVVANPCASTKLPKVVAKPKTAVTPDQFDALIAGIDERYRLLVLVAIESGMRWGELLALRPCDIDFTRRTIIVRRVLLEVTKKMSATGERINFRDYPKDNEQREVMIGVDLARELRQHMLADGIRDQDLLFVNTVGSPISRCTFRKRVWLPAVEASGLTRHVRFHDLRGAHASWLLAGGADLKVVMDRLGHRQITTTQQYLGALPDSGERALAAFDSVRGRH